MATLEELGWHFDSGKLVDSNGNPFVFAVSESKPENQKRYEEIGEAVTREVYGLLQSQFGLVKTIVPTVNVAAVKDEPIPTKIRHLKKDYRNQHSFAFHSHDVFTNPKLCIFINGSGVVRAGQWARSVIMNKGLEEGTMFPYIDFVMGHKYGVLVMNTNELGPGSESPIRHAAALWTDIVQKTAAKRIIIVAHSAGGVIVVELIDRFRDDFMNKVDGVFLTDSVHSELVGYEDIDSKLEAIAKNYVTDTFTPGKRLKDKFSESFKALFQLNKQQSIKDRTKSNTSEQTENSSKLRRNPELLKRKLIPRYSSGTSEHELTSHFAKPYIFADIETLEKTNTVVQEEYEEEDNIGDEQ